MSEAIDITPMLAAAIGRNPACWSRLTDAYRADRARYHAAARQSKHYQAGQLASMRAENRVNARRALGLILGGSDALLPVLRSGWRDTYDAVQGSDGPVQLERVIPSRVRHDDNALYDTMIVAVSLCQMLGKERANSDFDRDAMLLIRGEQMTSSRRADQLAGAASVPYQEAGETASKTFGAKSINSTSELLDASHEDPALMALYALCEQYGLDAGAYCDGIKLNQRELYDCTRHPALGAYISAALAMLSKAVLADAKYYDASSRDDQDAAIDAARQSSERATFGLRQAEVRASAAEDWIRVLDAQVAELTEQLLSHQGDAQELSALRDALYSAERSDDDREINRVKIARQLPERVCVIGGSPTLLSAIRDKYPSVTCIPPDVTVDTGVIERADEVWFVSDYIGHSQFYRCIDAARRGCAKIRYFSGAGKTRCLEELGMDDNQQ